MSQNPPFVSQLGNRANNDCGPACALMLLEWLGKRGTGETLDKWAQATDPEDNGTTPQELAGMLGKFGVMAKIERKPSYPYIALVQYAALPAANRIDKKGDFGHWIVRYSDGQYHDPYHWKGGQMADKSTLDEAERQGAARYFGGQAANVGIASGAARVAYDRVVNVIHEGASEDEAVSIFRAAWRKNRQTVSGSYDDAGVGNGLGSKTAVLHGIPIADRRRYEDFYRQFYPDTDVVFPAAPTFSAPPPAPPVPAQPPARARLGVNALNRHEEVCYAAAQQGCRFFVVLDNPGFASALKDRCPDATVMVRAYWDRQMPSVEGAIARMDGCRDARLIYTGLNEGDEVGQGKVEQIRQRAEFDLALARRIKEISGATYAAGTFSMGEPDFTNLLICSAIRALYAPAYNAGLIWWDHHLYSPRLDHVYQDDGLQWYETRWQFLFTQCGFDPDSPSRVVCSETGEDDGQRHGFAALGRSGDEVAAWGRRFVEVQSRPLVVDGVAHPSPFVGGALFQAGNREDWMGFNAERYYTALAEIWK